MGNVKLKTGGSKEVNAIADLMKPSIETTLKVEDALKSVCPTDGEMIYKISPMGVRENGKIVGHIGNMMRDSFVLKGNIKTIEVILYYYENNLEHRLDIDMINNNNSDRVFYVRRGTKEKGCLQPGYNATFHPEDWDEVTRNLVKTLRELKILDFSIKEIKIN